jgi:predicted hydrolase (HD superfamily)
LNRRWPRDFETFNGVFKDIYREIRIPLHHGIVGRYSRSREGNGGDWILDALWGDGQVHLTTSETAMESVIEAYGVDDLDHVISALELLTPKFQTAV